MLVNIGATEDDGMRGVREEREARAYLRRAALSSLPMRILAVVAVAIVLAFDANAARRPTTREQAEIVHAVAMHFERANPLVLVRVDQIVISTVQPGPRTGFTRFAIAVGLGRTALLGYYPSSKAWYVKSYGSKRAACRTSPYLFGGRRAAIFRDLGIKCP